MIKQLFDFLFSFVLFIFMLPILVLIAIFIVIDSKGGVFFLQERIGQNQKPFKIIKFRTMVKNAESKSGGVFTNKDDVRITRVGRFIRKYSLDELTQVFNIIKGEMSFVGPRPPVLYHPYIINEYPKKYIKRFDVKPGVTGLAQISGRTNIIWEKRFIFDIEYINRYSFWLDLKILFQTARNIFSTNEEVYPNEEYINKNHKL